MGILRLLLAISVVIAHTSKIFGFGLVDGQAAVQAFFIISGFYMALVLNEKYIGANNSYFLFLSNRLLRLYPIYWTVLLLTFLISLLAYAYTSGDFFGRIHTYYVHYDAMSIGSIFLLVTSNIVIFFQDIIMFLGLDPVSGELVFTKNYQLTDPALHHFLLIPQAWSIGIELMFYLLAPFIVRKKITYIYILICISIILRVLLYTNGLKNDPWSYRFFPTELLFFLLGIIAYHYYKKIALLNIKAIYYKYIFVFILFFTVIYSFIPFSFKIFIYLFAFFLSTPFVFILTKNWKSDRYIGELSYPIYISHFLVILTINYSKIPLLGGLGLITTIATLIFSVFLNELIAKKIEVKRQRRVK